MSDINDPRQIELAQRSLKQAYQAIEETPAMADHLAWLRSQEAQARVTAETEMDNPVRRALYLQDAIAYATVSSHLGKMFSNAQVPK